MSQKKGSSFFQFVGQLGTPGKNLPNNSSKILAHHMTGGQNCAQCIYPTVTMSNQMNTVTFTFSCLHVNECLVNEAFCDVYCCRNNQSMYN